MKRKFFQPVDRNGLIYDKDRYNFGPIFMTSYKIFKRALQRIFSVFNG